MSNDVIGVFHDHWARVREMPTTFRDPIGLWNKAVWYRANPRSTDYMKRLLAEHYPGATFLDVDRAGADFESLSKARTVVLLFPDAIGLGCGAVERRIARHAPRAAVIVINGRRRRFDLDPRTRWALRSRRFLEWTMLAEWGFGGLILVCTPFLLVFDLVSGKR